MSFTKHDLENIKSKIKLSTEIEKKTRVIKKGKDQWCCCLFHEEKTPSCKINDELGSYYCFGCGSKGDIFTIYTELYNFKFTDAVKELAQKAGIRITSNTFQKNIRNETIFKILENAATWFEKNLKENKEIQKYLEQRSLSLSTVNVFRIGYSNNPKKTLYEYLKDLKYKDEDILKSNLVKLDKNNRIRDFFYKRLIFPIHNEFNRVVGFGGRVLDNSNPKYINSPESDFFQKRSILYNLGQAKKNIRVKNNLLICEGYMDVISLYENNIKTAVAPLGTALTESQLLLAWKYVDKPTIMFDGDKSGLRASFKSALMALQLLTPNKFLQFIKLPKDYDPDSFLNNHSLNEFVKILKNPIPIVDFIFDQSSKSINLKNADNKISFDKYLDDIVETIKDKKIKFFYRNEFKKLFFEKLKSQNKKLVSFNNSKPLESLIEKQVKSFIASYLNHLQIRDKLMNKLINSNLLNNEQLEFMEYIEKLDLNTISIEQLSKHKFPDKYSTIMKKVMESSLFQLFPYCRKDYNSQETLREIEESIKNLNTRLLNLKKINKSLNEFEENTSSLTWSELKKITGDLHHLEDN